MSAYGPPFAAAVFGSLLAYPTLLVEEGDSKRCESLAWQSVDMYLNHRGFHSQSPHDYIRSFLKAEMNLQD